MNENEFLEALRGVADLDWYLTPLNGAIRTRDSVGYPCHCPISAVGSVTPHWMISSKSDYQEAARLLGIKNRLRLQIVLAADVESPSPLRTQILDALNLNPQDDGHAVPISLQEGTMTNARDN